MCPCQAVSELFVYLFISREMWDLLRPQISPKNTKTQISDEKKQKQKQKHSLKARQGRTKHVCKISGSNSQKRRGHERLKDFWVLCLNQPVASSISR